MTGRTGGLSSNVPLLDKLQVTGFGDLNILASTCNLLICKRIEKVVFQFIPLACFLLQIFIDINSYGVYRVVEPVTCNRTEK